jgi:hypothetical protein
MDQSLHGSSLTSVQIRTILNGQCSQTVFTSVKGIVDIVGGVLASGHGVGPVGRWLFNVCSMC